jgi:ribosomal protein S18 acetylase RimI-like enzyme
MNTPKMNSRRIENELDIQGILNFIKCLPDKATITDLCENLLLDSVRETVRLWYQGSKIVGFAFVDDYDNLQFETDPDNPYVDLEKEIIEWGITCMKKRNKETGLDNTLDYFCTSSNTQRIASIEKFGFERQSVRTLLYQRSLDLPIHEYPLPDGFYVRCIEGEHEVDRLVALHRAAFGTENMTIEQRLAIMHAPGYDRKLDFVALAPNGDFSAFCICGFEESQEHVGYLDTIGTHPSYQKLGLAKATVTAGLHALMDRGAQVVKTGTSSENIAMQRLADTLGFFIVAENLWFSKTIPNEPCH